MNKWVEFDDNHISGKCKTTLATRSEEQIRQNKKCSVKDFEIFHTAFLIAIQD